MNWIPVAIYSLLFFGALYWGLCWRERAISAQVRCDFLMEKLTPKIEPLPVKPKEANP